ncbi:MAG: transcriptional regulator, AraC family [Chitinophagaceae bacterium]|nr:transcriptional regulator, AraC family [Chitinophagaceae bacterium]
MSFKLKGISEDHFQHLDDFFLNGFESNELVEQSQKINHSFVEGHSNEWYFDGIRMGYSDWHYKKPVELEWTYNIKVELVTFQANLKGSVFMGSKTGNAAQLFGNYQHNLFYSNANDTNEGILKCERLRTSLFFIQFTKDAFLRLTGDANEVLNRFSEDVLNGRPSVLSVGNLPIDATMLNLISNIVNCSYKDGLKKMYLLSKSIEFLVLQAEACNAALIPSYRYIKTKYDKECILYAREYIMSHLGMPPSLSELAKIIGINEYKLKRGFKEIFDNTVFGYLSDARLEIAKNDLLKNKTSASQIASELGYSSVQHFSNAFKKKFGLSPNKLKS